MVKYKIKNGKKYTWKQWRYIAYKRYRRKGYSDKVAKSNANHFMTWSW